MGRIRMYLGALLLLWLLWAYVGVIGQDGRSSRRLPPVLASPPSEPAPATKDPVVPVSGFLVENGTTTPQADSVPAASAPVMLVGAPPALPAPAPVSAAQSQAWPAPSSPEPQPQPEPQPSESVQPPPEVGSIAAVPPPVFPPVVAAQAIVSDTPARIEPGSPDPSSPKPIQNNAPTQNNPVPNKSANEPALDTVVAQKSPEASAPPDLPVIPSPPNPLDPEIGVSKPTQGPATTSQAAPPAPQTPPALPLTGSPRPLLPAEAPQAIVPIGRSQVVAPAQAETISKASEAINKANKSAGPSETSVSEKTPAPVLTWEKKGPAQLRLGQAARFEIIVRNVGSLPARQIRIEDSLPATARVLGASPHSVTAAGRIVWTLPQLAAGAEERVFFDLQPTAVGELSSIISVGYAKESQSQVMPALVSLSVDPPEKAQLGKPVMFQIHLVNNSDHLLSRLILSARMSAGLTHPSGGVIESDPFDLPAGATKSLTLTTTATAGGPQWMETRVFAQGKEEACAIAETAVGEMALVLRVPSVVRLRPHRLAELRIDISNLDSRPARDVLVTSRLPAGLDFYGASDKGVHRPGNTVHWKIDSLPPGENRQLVLRVKSRSNGPFSHVVTASAADGLNAQAEGTVLAGGPPQLNLNISVRDNPVELGRETVFEAQLTNDGGSADTDVQIRAQLPEGMSLRSVSGPSAYRVTGRDVTFAPLPRLEPEQRATIRFVVRAKSPGDCRVRLQVAS